MIATFVLKHHQISKLSRQDIKRTQHSSMDKLIMENTQKYAKIGIANAVQNKTNIDNLDVKEIYVVKKNDDVDAWRAVLVDSFCQAGKTKKCFEILNAKIKKETGNTLVLFVTQANSLASANQTIQRATSSPLINAVIPPTNVFRSGNVPTDGVVEGNYMVVDFWNSRNMAHMIDFVRENCDMFATIIIVNDECDQGAQKGTKERLSFIRQVEKTAVDSIVKVIFITATVANLSKSVLQVANANLVKFKTGVVSEIINKQVVEHQFAEPHESYVGASWFKNTENVWTRLVFPKKTAEMTKEDMKNLKEAKVMEAIKALPKTAKELTLIVTSTRTADHSSLAHRLYRSGYNVTVEMNGTNNKNYKINYVDKSGGISTWSVPFSQIDAKADRGDLETFRNSNKKLVKTGISGKGDYSISHVLQAALFMVTDEETRIKQNTSVEEFNKLDAISNTIMNLDKALRRPNDFPEKPRVALIAGHLASRGITIQNPFIDFTCTSFCFTDTRDVVQRGATNTQRFGRACGMLTDAFARPNRQPILIATDGIVQDAIANEVALREKADSIENGTLISLKDMITKAEWDAVVKKTKDEIRLKPNKAEVTNKMIQLLNSWWNTKSMVGKILTYVYNNPNGVPEHELKAYIESLGSSNVDEMYRHLTRANKEYGLVFTKVQSKLIKVRPEAIKYINTLL